MCAHFGSDRAGSGHSLQVRDAHGSISRSGHRHPKLRVSNSFANDSRAYVKDKRTETVWFFLLGGHRHVAVDHANSVRESIASWFITKIL